MAGRPGGTGGTPTAYSQAKTGLELYDLKNDVGEKTDVANEHADIVARLSAAAEVARADLGDKLTKKTGNGTRPIGELTGDDERLSW